MATYTAAQVAARVVNHIDNIPSALTASSNAIIVDFVEEAHYEIELLTGDSFATTAVPESTLPALIYKTCIMVINYTLSSDYTIGKFSIKKNLIGRLEYYTKEYLRAVGNLVKGKVDFSEP